MLNQGAQLIFGGTKVRYHNEVVTNNFLLNDLFLENQLLL